MGEFTCVDARDAAPEAALGVLPDELRGPFAAHLLRCPTCRAEVESLSAVGRRLPELVPGTEPPLGFDRRVLARVRGRRRPSFRQIAVATTAAAAIALGVTIGLAESGGGSPPSTTARLTADLRQDGRVVGRVTLNRQTGWVNMIVRGSSADGMVGCELVGTPGGVQDLGWFQLDGGSGSWGTPDSKGFAGVTGAVIVDSHGHVVASATFPHPAA